MLKSKTKPQAGGKKRKIVPLLGSIQDYQTQKAQAEGTAQNIDLFASLKKAKEGQKPKPGKEGKMND